MPALGPSLFDYTGGRYLFNERTRLHERYRKFDVNQLAGAICSATKRPTYDLVSIHKFAEGGFNRILQATFKDGHEVLARIPFNLEAPLYHSVASEAATLTFLKHHGLPVPEVLDYSPIATNPVGVEYILLEKLGGKPLSESWFSLEPKTLSKVMKQLTTIEHQLMNIPLSGSGSLYFRKDLSDTDGIVPLPGQGHDDEIVLGPIASYDWWYQERARLDVDRGPWNDMLSCFEAPAKRELAYCQKYAQPRLHVERYLRELHDFQLQQPARHIELLSDYLKITPSLTLPTDSRFSRPVLRHPDLSPSNILVNDEYDIVGLIDWQHTVILPLCLCSGIPKYYQNWGDPISESLQAPETKLPTNFDSLSQPDQQLARETMRRRLVHFYYAALIMKKSEDHFDALRNENYMLRAKLFDRAGVPWEGDSLSLEHVLVEVQSKWPLSVEDSISDDEQCPISYSPEKAKECLSMVNEEEEKLDELEDAKEVKGIDSVGWVPNDEHLARAEKFRDAIKEALLVQCSTEKERIAITEHFPFDDHDE